MIQLNPDKKNQVYLNSLIFQFAIANAAFELFLASYKVVMYSEIFSPSMDDILKYLLAKADTEGNESEDNSVLDIRKNLHHTFWMQYPLLIIITLSANRFPLFSFLGTILDNAFGFRK